MRFIAATLLLAACGSPQAKHESAIVQGTDTPATCCCKTIPDTSDKDIVPVYTMVGRMECSTQHGDCVDDVQCNGNQPVSNTPVEPGSSSSSSNTGVPPPPPMKPDTESERTP